MSDQDFITKHLSDEQMREIAEDEFREMCRGYFNDNKSAAISNVAHRIVKDMVAEVLGEDADQVIRDKALEVINDLSQFTVFRGPDLWDRSPTPAWRVLMQAVEDNQDIVEAAVKKHLHNLSKRDALEVIKASKLTIQTGGEK